MNNFTGYDILTYGPADKAALQQQSIAFAAPPAAIMDEVDPTRFLKVENQGSAPSCVGNSITTVAECIAGLQAGDFSKVPQFSRKFAWENGQKKWMGRVDWKQGCTIEAGVKALIQDGVPRESVAPYEFKALSLTPEAYADAKNFKAKNSVVIGNAAEAKNFLGGGYGGIEIGVIWTQRMTQCRGMLRLSDVREDDSRGGHAVAIVGYRKNGNFLLVNSWGTQWGVNGVAEVEPAAMDYLLSRPYTVAIGITDLTGFDKVRVLKSWSGPG